jgi:hypothetical protein
MINSEIISVIANYSIVLTLVVIVTAIVLALVVPFMWNLLDYLDRVFSNFFKND